MSFVAGIVLAAVALGQEPSLQRLPQLVRTERVVQLHVDGKPFLVLGGELGNSNASDLATLAAAMDKCRRMHLNTILLPVYWDRIEAAEGTFDFSLVRGAIDLARERELRLVYLWFGTWKNSMSCYAPGWVKRDTTRFPRIRQKNGAASEIISPACEAAAESDARAFAALMRWTREYDATRQTVIMAQVENEIGMIPDARDQSDASEAEYRSAVPARLAALAAKGELGPEVGALWTRAGGKSTGTWAELFGGDAEGEEVFSAWQFATYVENVASAGKREYPLPMFANAALVRPNYRPGQYPSAGPLPHLLEVWRAGAPSLDMICPDIYFPNFMEWCERYSRSGNPLFVPEMAASMRATGNAVYALAHFDAIGIGPFSIENVGDDKQRLFASCYESLAAMSPQVLQAQRDGTVVGLSPQIGFDWSFDDKRQHSTLNGVMFEARFDHAATGSDAATTLPTLGAGRWDAPPGVPLGSVMILALGPEEFIAFGMGVVLTFSPIDGRGSVGIDSVQEGRFTADGAWVGGRWLNGDETHQGRHVHLYDGQWSAQRIKLYRY